MAQLSQQEDAAPHVTVAANLPVAEEASASSEVKHLYQRFRDSFGRPQVPSILQCFATHPPLLEHMLSLATEMLFVDGALGRQNKELTSAFVSAINRCDYCADSHAYAFCVQGGSHAAAQAALVGDLHSGDLTEEQRTLLRFAQTVTAPSQHVRPEDITCMRDAGFDDLQIAEAIHISALFAAFNCIVNAFGLTSQNLMATLEQERRNDAR